ncbi:manganese catalase family protein [Romboutsia sedimentorum]|uniref:manganese catalase family protein n=1 Tax=Romboutsia sedimentorum TaxID=1368474 RepID=UPI0024DE8834|nr:manganese catalase family protein [Romboutsia sedimentorum]MDK2587243.1 manganese catalase family protein [Romboutsia sedimentorum]
MFKHDKKLLREVKVEKPNPQYAVLMQEQLGGGNGELKAAMQYMAQSFRIKDPVIKDLFMDIASEQRAKVVYEYLYRQIEDKHVKETIDFLLNREEAHNALFRDALNKVKDTGSNKDFGVTEDSKLYFDLSTPGPNHDGKINITPPSFETPINNVTIPVGKDIKK